MVVDQIVGSIGAVLVVAFLLAIGLIGLYLHFVERQLSGRIAAKETASDKRAEFDPSTRRFEPK